MMRARTLAARMADGGPDAVFGAGIAVGVAMLPRLSRLVQEENVEGARKPAVKLIAEQLRGIGGARSAGFGPDRVRSVPDAIGKVLQEHYVDGNGMAHKTNGNGHSNGNGNGNGYHAVIDHAEPVSSIQSLMQTSTPLNTGEICPECHNATMMNEEGCRKCHTCGYSEC